MLNESDILFEIGDYWVYESHDWNGYVVMKNGPTHALKVARIGYEGDTGLERAIQEATQRHNYEQNVKEMKKI